MSGIQHFAFCRRQWALIHLEQQWSENLRTAEGRLLHDVTTILFVKTGKPTDHTRHAGHKPSTAFVWYM